MLWYNFSMSWKNKQVSRDETEKILEVVRGLLGFGGSKVVLGDLVEMGCYKGDTSLLLAEVLREYNRGESVEKPVENSNRITPKPVEKAETKPANPSIIELASNDDYSVATIAKEANRIKEREAGEVFISLH